jgi:hypothetical protein
MPGVGGPYSTVKTTFNGRDQATLVRQYEGSETSSTYQDSTASFDGHGRLATSHKPEQRDSSNNLKYTTYNYNTDDSISNVTDGRGVVTNYTYNSRGLVTNVGWNVGSTGITATSAVTFSYDNVGNRTAMTDGLGSVVYAYSSLSQMTSETRTFNDTLADKPTGNYNIAYEYAIGGQLKSYTDPYGQEIEYAHDKAGRLDAVTGTSFGGVTTYANNPQYRAWGALKHLEYGSGRQMNVTYNNGLRANTFVVNKLSDPSDKTMDRSYDYYNDGTLKFTDDNILYKLDRLFVYDFGARVVTAKSGVEASGGTETNPVNLPYRQTYTHDAFGHVMSRTSTLWNYGAGWDFSYTFTNNRSSGSMYDDDGRTIIGNGANFSYDARGVMIDTGVGEHYETTLAFDGDGQEVKRSNRIWNTTTNNWNEWETSYFVNSSVLGRMVSHTTATGKKKFTYVVGAGTVVARQGVDDANAEHVSWQHRDPSGLSSRSTPAGTTTFANFSPEERDGLGNNVGSAPNLSPPDRTGNSPSPSEGFTFDGMTWGDCELDGIMTPCSMVYRMGEALGIRIRYHNPRSGFEYSDIDINRELPGRRSMSIWIADELGPTDTDVRILEDFEQPNIWESIGGPASGQWITFSWDVSQRPRGPSPPVDLDPLNDDDCEFLVRVFKDLAKKHKSDWFNKSFIDEIRKELIDSLNPWSKDPAIVEKHNSLRSRGFIGDFTDESGSFNQVRHFAGGFVNAYYGGLAAYSAATAAQKPLALAEAVASAAAVTLANRRETDNSAGDIALNGVSAPMGVAFAFGSIGMSELADEIRSKVCDP